MARKRRSSSTEHYAAWKTLDHLQRPAESNHTKTSNGSESHSRPLQPADSHQPEEARDTIIKLHHLPSMPSKQASTACRPFAINVSFSLLHPQSLRSISSRTGKPTVYFNTRTAQRLCQQHSVAYIPTTHSLKEVVSDLIGRAASTFGLGSLVETEQRERWGYALIAACDAFEGCVGAENADFILSASKQGGRAWKLYIVEVERGADGKWESLSCK